MVLYPDFDVLSPVSKSPSPEVKDIINTNSLNSGDTGDKSDYIIGDKDKVCDKGSIINNTCINCPKISDSRIRQNHPFYYCKGHPKFQNIHLEVIKSHLILAKDHVNSFSIRKKYDLLHKTK
jgi:hypothetical protein